MALFSKVQEMAASVANEVRLIIKPTAPKAKEPPAKQSSGKTPKFDKAVVKPNTKDQSATKSSAVQTPASGNAVAKPVPAETNQTAKGREVVQPLTYSGPVKIPEPLPLELLNDDEMEMSGANANGNTGTALTPEPAAQAATPNTQTEDTIRVKKIERAIPKVELPEQKAESAFPVTKSETPAKQPETKAEAAKTPIASDSSKSKFADLFGKAVEEEETPLDRLMKSLPDITMEEVQNEAAEVRGLMNDWLQSKALR